MSTFLKKYLRHVSVIGLFSVTSFLLLVSYAFGATPDFVPLVGLPGLQNLDKNTSIPTYINAVYLTIVSVGALIGVVRLAIAGVKYSLGDIVTQKQEAKEDIKGVLLGLAILLIPFIVLNTIYPGLTNLDVLGSAQNNKVDLNKSSVTAPSANTTEPMISRTACYDAGNIVKNEECIPCPVNLNSYTKINGECKYIDTCFFGINCPINRPASPETTITTE